MKTSGDAPFPLGDVVSRTTDREPGDDAVYVEVMGNYDDTCPRYESLDTTGHN